MRHRVLIRALVSITATLALSGCGGSAPDTGAQREQGGRQYNQADVTFLQGMIPHHQQAIEMSQLSEGRVESEQVRRLAADIEAAQGPEIEQMTGLLEGFGAKVPSAGMGGHGSMAHGSMDHGSMGGMQGMMSPEQMQRMEQASGPEFDRMFLEMMIEHHQGAVIMSEQVLQDGRHPAVGKLARQIIEVQEAEIATMSALLAPA